VLRRPVEVTPRSGHSLRFVDAATQRIDNHRTGLVECCGNGWLLGSGADDAQIVLRAVIDPRSISEFTSQAQQESP
jgi:hypothetical protein